MPSLSKIFYSNVSLGSWFGVPVNLHSTWVITFMILAITNPNFALCWFAMFIIVVMHEFGHIFMGKIFGCKAHDVTLYPFGGAAKLEMNITFVKSHQEFLIAIAGPLVNVFLIPFLGSIIHLSPALVVIYFSNIALIFFNLLPIFPMDGGRILRSILQMISGNMEFATYFAVRVSQSFCFVLVAIGISYGNIILALLGFILFSAAQSELCAVSSICLKDELQNGIIYCEQCKAENVCVASADRMMNILQIRLKELEQEKNE